MLIFDELPADACFPSVRTYHNLRAPIPSIDDSKILNNFECRIFRLWNWETFGQELLPCPPFAPLGPAIRQLAFQGTWEVMNEREAQKCSPLFGKERTVVIRKDKEGPWVTQQYYLPFVSWGQRKLHVGTLPVGQRAFSLRLLFQQTDLTFTFFRYFLQERLEWNSFVFCLLPC